MKVTQGDDEFAIVAEINMVPLIDISLVLLIIFMVMTPLLVQSQIKINLPGANSGVENQDQKHVTVTLDQSGAIFINGQPVNGDAVESSLRGLIVNPESDTVVVEADRDVDFGRVVTVMDTAKRLGVKNLGVAVQEVKKSRSP